MDEKLNNENAPLCECGCGQQATWNKNTKRYSRYIFNHYQNDPEWRKRVSDGIRKRNSDPQYRAKMSERTKELWRDPEYRAKVMARYDDPEFVKKNQETLKRIHEDPISKEKHRKALIKVWENPEYKQKMTAKRNDPEWKKRHSDILKTAYKDPELRRKMEAYWQNPERKKKLSEGMRIQWRDKGFREKYQAGLERTKARKRMSAIMLERWQDAEYRNQMLARFGQRPNKLESLFDSVTTDRIRYVGDGSWWRRICLRLDSGEYIWKSKNPDFKITGEDKVIELFGDYWHRNDNPDDLILAYKNAGIDCLVLWEYEVNETIEDILIRVSDFIGEEVCIKGEMTEFVQLSFAFAAD